MYFVYFIIVYTVYNTFISVSQMSPLKLLSQDKIGDFLNLLPYPYLGRIYEK